VVVPDSSRDHHWCHDNTTARTIAFGEGEVVNRDALPVRIRQVIADNQAGDWRKIKTVAPPTA